MTGCSVQRVRVEGFSIQITWLKCFSIQIFGTEDCSIWIARLLYPGCWEEEEGR
jgi:hypothetical protein